MSGDNTASDRAFGMSELGSALPGLTAAARAGLVNALKDKVQMLAGQQANALDSLSPNVKKRVVVLQQIQAQYDQLESKFYEEKAELEARYQQLYQPLYTKRFEIVNGLTEVEGVAGEPSPMEENTEKGIPEFWLNAMKTNETLAMQISERDEDALKYLKDIKWSRIDNPKGFKLEFFFDINPYFKNAVLTKIYHMIEDDEPILEQAIGTKIEWHAGKNLTQKVMRKKPKKGVKNAKAITKIEDCDSFFNFFSPPEVPDDDEEIDQDTAEQLQELMEQDYDIGSTIRDKIIPHAVSWFTGEALQGEDYEDAEEGDSEDLDEDDDDDDDVDDDVDDDEDEDEDQDEEDVDEGKGGKVL